MISRGVERRAGRALLAAVIGNPVEHSLSPVMHSRAALDAGLELQFGRIPHRQGRRCA
jgi:shikimate 5-dehydrogenase